MKIFKRLAKKISKRRDRRKMTVFRQRLIKRHHVLWEEDHAGIHDALACKAAVMSRDDSLLKWHCCYLWQRKLSNKWNSREFASKFACKVPDLYWYGKNIQELDFASLPAHYVIRPALGWSGRSTFAMTNGVNLLDGKKYTTDHLKKLLSQLVAKNPLTYVLVEEFVRTESSEYRLPNEYKVHIFNENIATIQVIRRKRRKEAIHRFYTEAWEPFDDVMNSGYPLDVFLEPPQCLDEMLRAAKTLGKAYNAFVRIDFYATDRGCVFGEFTPTPNRGVAYTDYASDYFEKLWRETYPDPNHI